MQNPFNPASLHRVCLEPGEVDAIVFWTRNAEPILKYLPDLDRAGYHYYFHYTITGSPRCLDPYCPAPDDAVETFKKLAKAIGPHKVIWRYDPIAFTLETGTEFHREMFKFLAVNLRGFTKRVMISLVQVYRKNRRRLGQGASMLLDPGEEEVEDLMKTLASIALANDMEIYACAQETDRSKLGIRAGACIDPELINRLFGLNVSGRKDPGQRAACRCAVSRDIGSYDTCIYGCRYCYATTSIERARRRFAAHDPSSPMLAPPV